MTPFNHTEFGGTFLAPDFTDERGRKKMIGSIIFYEAESIEEVRKVVESDPYYTDGAVREPAILRSNPQSTLDPFGVVGQREARNSPFCAGNKVAVDIGGTNATHEQLSRCISIVSCVLGSPAALYVTFLIVRRMTCP